MGGKLPTFAAGNLGSLFCTFSYAALAPPFNGGGGSFAATSLREISAPYSARFHHAALAPPFNGGEAPRNICGGKSRLLILHVFIRPPWLPPSKRRKLRKRSRWEISAPYSARFHHATLAPPLTGGKLRATFAVGNLRSLFCTFSSRHPGPPSNGGEAPRNVCGGKSPLLILHVFNRPPWPPLCRGELGATSAAGNQRCVDRKVST